MKPIKNKALIKPISKPNESESGIFLGEVSTKTKFMEKGTLIEKGPDVYAEIPLGSIVYYDRYAGTPISISGEGHLVMRNDEIQAYELVK